MALSPILKIPLLSANQTGKETTINDAVAFLEKAQNDAVVIDFTDGDVVLPAIDLLRYFYFRTSNVAGAVQLTIPENSRRIFALDNSEGSNAVTVAMGTDSLVCATGETYVIAASPSALKFLYNSTGAGGTIAFPSLSDVPDNYTGMGGYIVVVKEDETGLEFVNPDDGTIGFLNLNDGPASYEDNALKLVRANAAEDGVEFVDPARVIHVAGITEVGGTTYSLQLSDLGKIVRTTNVSATQITIPPNAFVAYPIGTQVHIRQAGEGTVELIGGVGGAPVTLNTPSSLFCAGQHGTITVIKVAEDEWDVLGSLAAL